TVFSMGINQSTNGSDKGNAIINCHLATGRIGKPGMGPFSITGQPNAMGGREVGGLANQLVAHRDFDDAHAIETVANFWGSTHIARQPGLKAVDLFEAVYDGKVKAIWIMATNPAVSLPNSARVVEALKRCDLVVVSDCVRRTDTTALADILLPALAWGEKDGTVTSAERTISRQRAFLPRPGNARADWRIICDVARAMGFGKAFDYPNAADIFREHAQLSRLLNGDGSRAFDIGALAGLSDDDYDMLRPSRWPLAGGARPRRPFSDGRFYTASGKAHCVAVVPQAMPAQDQGVVLNTGRSRDQWHTMTRSARSPRLLQHRDEPFVELHPTDAEALRVRDGELVALEGGTGRYVGRAAITNGVNAGQVFAPIHWNRQYAKHGKVCDLVPAAVDPISGQPAFKHASVQLSAFSARWRACVVSTARPSMREADYWCLVPQGDVQRLELSGDRDTPTLQRLQAVIGHAESAPWLFYQDNQTGTLRSACLQGEQLLALVAITCTGALPNRMHTRQLFEQPVPAHARLALLAGVPTANQPDTGRVVCACHGVGEMRIVEAIRQHRAVDIDSLGQLIKAGTGCGSCLPELRDLITAHTSPRKGAQR
ncbi:MAG: molybdopterin-dependent oxidoreductase, partial [Pseudomonadota bacterium]